MSRYIEEMQLDKDEYVLRSLSKIRHKRWELFVISRILHGLSDPEIEFVCQQLVRRPNGERALVDLYFPQFGLYLEVDEPQHAGAEHAAADRRRAEDIVNVADLQEYRIKVYGGVYATELGLKSVAEETDRFIGLIKDRREKAERSDTFIPWDFETRYSPEPHIKRGFLSLETNPVFRFQRDALRCFGYKGGHYQRGSWTLAPDPSRAVWFPRLYETDTWDNDLSPDGTTIIEKRKSNVGGSEKIRNPQEWESRIVMARHKDSLGTVMYRFVGEFRFAPEESSDYVRKYRRIATKVDTLALVDAVG